MRHRMETQLRAIARDVVGLARRGQAEVSALRADKRVHPSQIPALVAEHGAMMKARYAPLIAKARQELATFRDQTERSKPSFRPVDSLHSGWVNTVAANAPHFSPRVMEQTLRKAIDAGDHAMITALLPICESFAEYKKSYQGPEIISVLVDAKLSLNTPQVQEANAALDWAQQAEREVNALERMVAVENDLDRWDVTVQQGGQPILAPERSL